MTDTEFCIEFVKRIQTPLKRKTTIEMKQIVEQKVRIDPSTMFDDAAINELLRSCSVTRFVYTYIRDNQDLFINHV